MRKAVSFYFAVVVVAVRAAVPVAVAPVTAKHGLVVAGHPEAAAAGLATLKAGGNAVDAAITIGLALGVAEPYGSGLGGKLMFLHYEAASGRTLVIDAMEVCGTALESAVLRQLPATAQSSGYTAVCVPGQLAGLWMAHRRWGSRAWADNVAPAIALARDGFEVLAKNRDLFEEQERKLRGGDPEIARLYLPGGQLPAVGARLKNEDLARTLEGIAQRGRDGFYRGAVAEAIVAAARKGGGPIALRDFENYEARAVDPLAIEFRGYQLLAAPPPAIGPAMFFTALKVVETQAFGGSLRTAENLDRLGRVWRHVEPECFRLLADAEASRFHFEKLVAPESLAEIRRKVFGSEESKRKVAAATDADPAEERVMAATTHFIVVDRHGNIVCATQSLGSHFGAGVVAPGTGVVLNNSMGNFSYGDSAHLNAVAPGKRPRSTISPTIVLRDSRPIVALGVPGSTLIPTTMLQVLIDRLVLDRPLAEAIGDTRVHFVIPWRSGQAETIEAERSLPAELGAALRERGWQVTLREAAGRGRRFGGMNAIERNADGSWTGYADPRRTNTAAGD